ncbi:unnamed protein product [Adineta steineri]|uniref:Kinesin motor domain-containing protein n=1 Tax=Adineta steineri TaxID=433720 RepID=A0A818Y6L7_9BILA|nr:unnamed protein product [Adineta steineri]
MTKCLLKALKAVDLEKHVELFRSLGYDSAGALAHFHKEHFKRLILTQQELLRFHALLDVLKEATREGKICPHYSKANKPIISKSASIHGGSSESIQYRNSQLTKTNVPQYRHQSNENLQSKRISSSLGITGRLSSASVTNKSHANGFILQRPTSALNQQPKTNNQQFFGPKSIVNRPAVQHVKVKSYNYGVPTNKRQRNVSHRNHYQHEAVQNHSSIFVPSHTSTNDIISYAKPAEIYVYARKRPLLLSEIDFYDTISVLDNKHLIIAENKANVDCTSSLKKTEFQFDQVFGSDASNKQVFESTVLPFIVSNHRHNLTYICFGQTGSGKSHTIFGSRSTDGLLIHCTQLLLKEINLQNKLICSFYEIYNNQVYDLSNTGKRLYVREDGEHRVNIVGITEIVLRNLDTLRSVISDGLSRRHHGKSAFNSNSSRSHAIFQIILKNTSNQADNFRLIFIDLAGSERATDAQNNQRETRREGAQINSSLLALKECIRSMDMTQSHAPFRQSKLTHILRDSLVGSKTRTCLMANVSPPDDCCQCSLNTLQYASRIRDISIRHRHRSMSLTNIQRNHFEDEQQQHVVTSTVRERPQKTFKPATASTPVHRLVSSVDHRTYMSTNQPGINNYKRTTTKSDDINWQIPDNDIPISGSGDNPRLKSALSSTREFLSNMNTNNQNQSSSFYLTRYEQSRKKPIDRDGSPSSYFPLPQSDIKKSSIIQTNDIKKSSLIQTNEIKKPEQWKTVPAPPVLSARRYSDSSTEPQSTTRIIPIAPIPMSDDNQYSSATGTESLGTKITKLATGIRPHKRSHKRNAFIEKLNLHKQYDTGGTTTLTADTDQGIYSDRQATHRDQTGFFSNRDDEPIYENNLKSSHLTTIVQVASPTATPKNTSYHHQHHKSDVISSSSKKSFSSPNKAHHRHQPIESSSSSTSLTSMDSKKHHYSSPKRRHRIVPYHNNQNYSDSEDYNQQRKTYSTRNESCQTRNNIHKMKNEQEQTEDQFLLEQFSDPSSNNFMQAPLDQVKRHYTQTLSTSTPLSKPLSSSSPMTILFDKYPNRNGIIPLNNHSIDFRRRRTDLIPVMKKHPQPFDDNIYLSPLKEYGVHVSDQLNTLRTLLETRLKEQDDVHHHTKDSSILQTSPGTFTKEFLQSYQQTKYKDNPTELISDLDDDDDDIKNRQQIKEKYGYYDTNRDKYQSDILSTSTVSSNQHESSLIDEVNQARIRPSATTSTITTVTPNYADKIHSYESRVLSNSANGLYSHQSINKTHQASISNSDVIGNTSNPTSDSEHISEVISRSQNPYTRTLSGGSLTPYSPTRSPLSMSLLKTFDKTNGTHNDYNHSPDIGKSSSLLTGTSFDVLMSNLKSMREKDLDLIIHNNDDNLIRLDD